MPSPSDAITLSAALIAGIAGSAHCFFMCGGIAGALSLRSRNPGCKSGSVLRSAALYHSGRLLGYAMSGALFGALGSGLLRTVDIPSFAAAMRVAAGALLVLIAIRVFCGWNSLVWIERFGAHFWRALQPLTRRLAGSDATGRSLLLGLLWGWLPCGLIYSMLLFAALSGSALRGSATMLMFGLGTFPVMLASSLYASHATRRLQQGGARRWSGALLLLFGLWMGWAAITTTPHVDHRQHLGDVHEHH